MTEQERIQALEAEVARLKERLSTEKLVCRAKCLLVERRGYTEESAHHYLERLAMDRQETRRAVAERIVEEYGHR